MRRAMRLEFGKQSQQDQNEHCEQGGKRHRESGLHLDEVCGVHGVGSSVDTVMPTSATLRYDYGGSW